MRIFSAQGESTKQRETKGGDQSKAVTNIFISLFSEVTSVQQSQQGDGGIKQRKDVEAISKRI